MDTVTFWKHYGRELETILDKAHKREAERLSNVVKQPNHYLYNDEKHSFKDLGMLKMILSVVIAMNRSDEVDGQKPLTP